MGRSLHGVCMGACIKLTQLALQALQRARRQRIENVNMLVVSAHQDSLAKEAQEQLALVGPLYAVIILEQSSCTHPGMHSRPHREDNLFFEALYKVCSRLCPISSSVSVLAVQGLTLRKHIQYGILLKEELALCAGDC